MTELNRGRKDDQGKPRYSLLPLEALEAVVQVLEHGAARYGVGNWRLVPGARQRYLDACLRHVLAVLRGEDVDKDSGLPHLAHAVSSLLFVMDRDSKPDNIPPPLGGPRPANIEVHHATFDTRELSFDRWTPHLPGPRTLPYPSIPMRLAPGAHAPAYQTAGAAGLDLHALTAHTLHPGERLKVATGVHLAIPDGYEGQVRPRSSFNSAGILCALGTIDSDYRGDIGVILTNTTAAPYEVAAGARIAQLVIAPVARVELQVVDALPPSERGAKGWGSTGA